MKRMVVQWVRRAQGLLEPYHELVEPDVFQKVWDQQRLSARNSWGSTFRVPNVLRIHADAAETEEDGLGAG